MISCSVHRLWPLLMVIACIFCSLSLGMCVLKTWKAALGRRISLLLHPGPGQVLSQLLVLLALQLLRKRRLVARRSQNTRLCRTSLKPTRYERVKQDDIMFYLFLLVICAMLVIGQHQTKLMHAYQMVRVVLRKSNVYADSI